MSSIWLEGEVKAYRDRFRRAVHDFEIDATEVSEGGLNAAGIDIIAFLRRRVAFEQEASQKLLAVKSPDLATRHALINHLETIKDARATVRAHTVLWRAG